MSTELDPDVIRYITEYPCNRSGTAWVHYTIANKVMLELVKSGYADFLFLKNDEVREWWMNAVFEATTAIEKHKEAMRLYEIKIAVYERLPAEDRKVLGLRKPAKPRPLFKQTT